MKSIGVDLGTTSISVDVLDFPSLSVWRKESLETGEFLVSPQPWERTQNPEDILSRVQQTLDNLLDMCPDVAAIGLTGQMHGILYVDGEGNALSPLYTWQDGRGSIPLSHGKSACQLLEELGAHCAPGYGMGTHLYNSEMGLVPPGAESFCTIADWLGMALTGRKSPLLHQSQAAGLGVYDSGSCSFKEEVTRTAGMNSALFPKVTGELSLLGEYRGIPVSVSLGDNQASFLGSVRHAQQTILVNVGTGAQISLYAEKAFQAPGIESRPFLGSSCLLVGSTLCGGAAYAALEGFFREYALAAGAPDQPQYDVMARLLKNPISSPWQVRTTFAGTREDPCASGSVQGIRRENFHPVSLIAGVLSGISQELYNLYQVVECGTGLHPDVLVASGNGVRRNPFLQHALAETFAMPLSLVEHQEEAAFGAALSALESTGRLSLREWLGF